MSDGVGHRRFVSSRAAGRQARRGAMAGMGAESPRLCGGRAKLSRAVAILEWTTRAAFEIVPALRGSHAAKDGLPVDELGLAGRAGEGRCRDIRLAGESGGSFDHSSLEKLSLAQPLRISLSGI
jgi:hypothetical protein